MEFNVFDSIKIGLASPEQIRSWSHGEVTKPETINYRTQKPERDGLFCERIFGPTKDWECHCGKYKKIRFKGKVCERCGVEVTRAKVRRERMGHIELAAPVSHIWYFKGTPSRIGQMLEISSKRLEEVLYFTKYIVTDPGDTGLVKKQILTEREYQDAKERYEDKFTAKMGAEAIQELLREIDVEALSNELKAELKDLPQGQKRIKLLKRLEIVEAFRTSGNKPEWMIMDVVPVIPPDLRPMVPLDGGRYATSDLNDLYRRVINRNNRLKRMLELDAPDIIIRNEKRMLQEAVDALIDNGRHGRPVTGPNNRAFKSLSDMLKGKQGRFRQNLLGKRVDYSGRSVIVVGPELKMYQCGLPKEMALELFKPFVMKRLVDTNPQINIKSARKMVEKGTDEVWDALENVIQGHPVLLNRAPTLHRLGIQAFEPVLVEGRALKFHPLACTAYNADFDGDQMSVHVPLSVEAQAEARFLMLAANNLLKPADGKPVTVPTQDMVLGSYYLTLVKDGEKGEGKIFRDVNEAMMAYQSGIVSLQAKIKVRVSRMVDGEEKQKIIDTTVGRLIFNESIPQDLGYVDRKDPETMFGLEVDFLVKKKQLGDIIDHCLKKHGTTKTSEMLDNIKAMGYKYSTKSGITVAVSDAVIPPQKKDILADADSRVDKIDKQYKRGLISRAEKSKRFIEIWSQATDDVTTALQDNMDKYNPIYMMSDSGARGSLAQIRQLAGMRGLIANTSGATIEMPIRANYREGLTVLEYFISSRGARKGLTDTALRTADSGYLTRRLVDVSQDVIITEDDCGTHEGIDVFEIRNGNELIEPFDERLVGRFLVEDLVDESTGEVIMSSDKLMTHDDAVTVIKYLESVGRDRIAIRSVLGCKSKRGVCAKCYGMDLAHSTVVSVGEAVGIIAAQSIGEPGTQLTMRTFHTGGVASAEDITQGLPRVEELFESRKPKGAAILSKTDGVVSFDEIKKSRVIVVTNPETGDVQQYSIPWDYRIVVKEGEEVKAGDLLTAGSKNPADILAIQGTKAVRNYIITEVQKVYRLQGVDVNDKHIEVITRQMLRRVKVEDPGSSYLLPGSLIDRNEVEEMNRQIQEEIDAGNEDARLITTSAVIQGITKASSSSESFLSAASFQETTRALTDAAIKGKTDHLLGLKENVIIGKLLPAGTGMQVYNNVEVVRNEAFAEHNAPTRTMPKPINVTPLAPIVDDEPEEEQANEAPRFVDTRTAEEIHDSIYGVVRESAAKAAEELNQPTAE
ncbi:MAG: DNA-directed RNA polymerase subunit beta' [Oscillospiraceae bacterium]|nr:DNA-directed RNA polymerase subunit beta' [Oscillospiraceae bacterium]